MLSRYLYYQKDPIIATLSDELCSCLTPVRCIPIMAGRCELPGILLDLRIIICDSENEEAAQERAVYEVYGAVLSIFCAAD